MRKKVLRTFSLIPSRSRDPAHKYKKLKLSMSAKKRLVKERQPFGGAVGRKVAQENKKGRKNVRKGEKKRKKDRQGQHKKKRG